MSIEVDPDAGRPEFLFMTAATSDRPSSGVGVVYFAFNANFGTPLRAIDYQLAELHDIHDPDWLYSVFTHAHTLRTAYRPYGSTQTVLHAEGLLHETLARTFATDGRLQAAGGEGLLDLYEVERTDILAMNFDQRMLNLRMLSNGGKLVKVRGAGRRRFRFRNITATYLLNQLAATLPGRKEPQELAAAMALGALLMLTDETTVPRGSGSSSLGSISAFGG